MRNECKKGCDHPRAVLNFGALGAFRALPLWAEPLHVPKRWVFGSTLAGQTDGT
jgi:hypothetical protein